MFSKPLLLSWLSHWITNSAVASAHFGAVLGSLIYQNLGCLAARDLSHIACVKVFRDFVGTASQVAFAARFGDTPSVLQPGIDERALWNDIIL